MEDDASSKLSMSEKLALFNKLSQPILGAAGCPKGDGGSLEAGERRRLKGARYRTQPITIDEVNLVGEFGVRVHIGVSACVYLFKIICVCLLWRKCIIRFDLRVCVCVNFIRCPNYFLQRC